MKPILVAMPFARLRKDLRTGEDEDDVAEAGSVAFFTAARAAAAPACAAVLEA